MEEQYIYQGRIAIGGPRNKKEFKQHTFSGVLISQHGQPDISNSEQWEGIQCEIIIKPIKRLGTLKFDNARLDQAAMALGNEQQWE